jgi:hypothetical protein
VVGVGIWGINIPIGWGFAIVNFVWWIGIGHAGTLISAILLLLRQQWRTSINRFAEAMTLFAVACAGLFPILHLGVRGWLLAAALSGYDETLAAVPQPAGVGLFAVSTYATVSLLFWYVGLVPDLATLRDRSKNRVAKILYGILAMGWRGSAVHWYRHETASLLLAGLGYAAGRFRAHHRQLRFCFRTGSRLALDDFPAVFRGRSCIPRFRDGADSRDSGAQIVSSGRFHHRGISTTWARSCWPRASSSLRLHVRDLHRMVQREYLRAT